MDRSQTDSSGRLTLPRRPKESALATACLSAGLPAGEAKRRFGSFADDGSSYVVPDRSACRVWSGQTPDGTRWTLLLADLTGSRTLAWLRDSATSRWTALDEIAGRPAIGVAGAHRRAWGTPEREISLTPSGADLAGTITVIGGSTSPVTLTRDPWVGTWLGGPWPVILLPLGEWEKGRPDEATAPEQPPTPYVGRWLNPSQVLDGSWVTVKALTLAGGVLELDLGHNLHATLTAAGGTLDGTVTQSRRVLGGHPHAPVPPSTPAHWIRADDDLDH